MRSLPEGCYRARFYDPSTGQFTQPDSLVADLLHPAAWNRFSYVHNALKNYVDPSGHLAWWAPSAIGFIIGSLTNVTAGALQSDDPANYLLSQEAGIDLLVGGTFGALAVGLTPGVVALGMAAELSAGRTLFYQAVGFGVLNWMQAESSVILKHELLGYEKTHLAWRERGASFAYGFFSLYLAEGAARLLGPPVISAFRRTSQSSWLRDVAPGPIRKYVNLVSTKSYYDVTSQFGREGWKVIEDQVVEGLSRSTSGNILLFAYGQGLGFAWGIKNILLNPNILPVWTPIRQ